MTRSQKSILIFGFAVVLVVAGLILLIYVEIQRDRGERMLTVAFLDVGQGDAIFIETPNRKQMLIDGGPDNGVLRELGGVMPFWDRSIDVVLATHPDKDHIGGLIGVLKNYRVGAYVDSGITADTEVYTQVETLVDQERATELVVRRGYVWTLDKDAGVFIEVLSPNIDDLDTEDRNDTSIMVRLVYGETSFLLTGDAGIEIENTLVRELGAEEIDSDVLKLGHHGSKTSTSLLFLEAVTPDVAVISAGKDNRYGHPHADVLSKLDEAGVSYLGTYDTGRIVFKSNGISIKATH